MRRKKLIGKHIVKNERLGRGKTLPYVRDDHIYFRSGFPVGALFSAATLCLISLVNQH